MEILNESTFIGLFPNRKPRTGCTPSLNDLSIWPCSGTDPFKEIEDQSVNRIWHHDCGSLVILTGLKIAMTSSLSPPNAGDNWCAHSTLTRDWLAARPVHPLVRRRILP